MILIIAATILTTSTITSILMGSTINALQLQQRDQQPSVTRIQNTSMSVSAPNEILNNQSISHRIVVALPIRRNGKIWTGTVTFTASKPLEVEVEHKHDRYTVVPDARHGEPNHGKWFDGTNIALSTMTMFTNTLVSVANIPISTGSFTFTGSALVFHKTDGVPFTVTYTLDAVANPSTK